MKVFNQIMADLDAKHGDFWSKVAEVEAVIIDEAFENRQFLANEDISAIVQAKQAAANLLAFARNVALGMAPSSPVQTRHLERADRDLSDLIAFADEAIVG